MESLFYNLLYLAMGRFPWTDDSVNDEKLIFEDILFFKGTVEPEELFQKMPSTYTAL